MSAKNAMITKLNRFVNGNGGYLCPHCSEPGFVRLPRLSGRGDESLRWNCEHCGTHLRFQGTARWQATLITGLLFLLFATKTIQGPLWATIPALILAMIGAAQFRRYRVVEVSPPEVNEWDPPTKPEAKR